MRVRSISSVRQRWSRRSRGPSNDSTRMVMPLGSATTVIGWRRSSRCSYRQVDSGADLGHGLDRDLPRATRAFVQDLHELGGLLRVVLAPLADLRQQRQHVLEQDTLAVE